MYLQRLEWTGTTFSTIFVLSTFSLANPIAIIGGPGKVVEINESKFSEYLHRKITMFVSICVCMWMGTGCLEG